VSIQPTKVSPTEEGIRLMRWFSRHYPRLSQGEFRKLCRTGQIRVNAGRVRGGEILHANDMIRVPPVAQGAALKPGNEKSRTGSGGNFSLADLEKLRQRIIHDDDDIVVFNKPAGLASQGGTGISKSLDKMAAALFPHSTVLLVHRLDRETSGAIVLAKNQSAAQILSGQFQSKTAGKEYLALLSGSVGKKRGTIDNFVSKGHVMDAEEAEIFKAQTGFKPHRAVTRYKILGEVTGENGKFGALSWVQFMPDTGRTHQLRMHAALSLGAPIVGDRLYGRPRKTDNRLKTMMEGDRLFLLSHRLAFRHPRTGKNVTIRAPLPEFMKSATALLGFEES